MQRSRVISISVLAVWALLFAAVTWYLRAHHLSAHEFPAHLHQIARSAGVWGVVIMLGAYIVAVAIPIPTMAFAMVAGTAYGMVFGTVLAIVGFNLSTSLGFWGGRLIGRRYVQKHENAFMKKYDAKLCEQGFLTVFFMRLFFFPSELVNIASGLTAIQFRSFALGTCLGSLPWILSFTLLGNAMTQPRSRLTFVVLFVAAVLCALLLRRTSWARRRLSSHEPSSKPTV